METLKKINIPIWGVHKSNRQIISVFFKNKTMDYFQFC